MAELHNKNIKHDSTKLSAHRPIGSSFASGLWDGDLVHADAWIHVVFGPEPGKVQHLPDGPGDLEPQHAASANELRYYVNDLPSQGVRVKRDRNNFSADDFLERLIQKERNAHEVVEGRIGTKPLKRKPLIDKLLEDKEGQLAPATTMIAAVDLLGREHRVANVSAELLIDPAAHAEVGVKYITGSGEGEQRLIVFYFFASNIAAPFFLCGFSNLIANIRAKLPAAGVVDVSAFHCLERLLVHVVAVEGQNDGNIVPIAASNPVRHISNYPLGPMALVAVLVPGTENRIADNPLRGHLKRPKPFVLLVGGHHAPAPVGFIVVHAHDDIDIEKADLRWAYLEPLHKEFEQDTATDSDQWPGEGLKEVLDPVGRDHMAGTCVDGCSITPILLQGVEIGQVPSGAFQVEARDLLEKTLGGNPFPVFAKPAVTGQEEHRNHFNFISIPHEKGHASTCGNTFIGLFDLGDFALAFAPAGSSFADRIPYLSGESL